MWNLNTSDSLWVSQSGHSPNPSSKTELRGVSGGSTRSRLFRICPLCGFLTLRALGGPHTCSTSHLWHGYPHSSRWILVQDQGFAYFHDTPAVAVHRGINVLPLWHSKSGSENKRQIPQDTQDFASLAPRNPQTASTDHELQRPSVCEIQKATSISPRNVPALAVILNVLQQSCFLRCVNQICFRQVFLTARGGNWAKLVYVMAPPSTHTDSAELEANSGGIIVNWMEASTACLPSTRARYCSSPKQAAAVWSVPTSWLSTEAATEGQQLRDTK